MVEQLRQFVAFMAGETLPCRAAIFSHRLLFQMTVPTQVMKLLFDKRRDCRIGLVTFETQAKPRCIGVVVVAIDAIDALVIHVCEVDGQHRRATDALVTQHGEHYGTCHEYREYC